MNGKKWLCALLASVMLLAASAALAEGDAAPESTPFLPPLSGDPFSAEKDLGLLIDGTFYPLFGPVAPLLEALGDPLAEIAVPGLTPGSEEIAYDYEYGTLFTFAADGEAVWYEFFIADEGLATPRGLKVGDPVSEMLFLYGDGCYMEGTDLYVYSLSGDPADLDSPCILFEAEDGRVVVIDIYHPLTGWATEEMPENLR